jgi:hypothetical protein
VDIAEANKKDSSKHLCYEYIQGMCLIYLEQMMVILVRKKFHAGIQWFVETKTGPYSETVQFTSHLYKLFPYNPLQYYLPI